MIDDNMDINEQAVNEVNAQSIKMTQSAAQQVEADRIEMQQSAAQSIDADVIEMRQSAAQIVQADTLRMQQSLALGARADTLQAEQSMLGVLQTHEATLADSALLALVGDRVQAANVNTVFLIGREIQGDVKTMLDTRGAVIFGLAAGSVLGFFSLLSAMIRRSRR